VLNLVGADVLGNPPGLGSDDVSFPDGIQERCLAVVDVTHYRNHAGTPFYESRVFLRLLHQEGFQIDRQLYFYLVSEFAGQNASRISVDLLVDSCHYAQVHQLFNQFSRAPVQLLRQFLDGDGLTQDNGFLFERLKPCRRLLSSLRALPAAGRTLAELCLRCGGHGGALIGAALAAIFSSQRFGRLRFIVYRLRLICCGWRQPLRPCRRTGSLVPGWPW